jgi:zinc transport system substrate-binding protein
MTRYSNSVIAVVSFAILFYSIFSFVFTSVNGGLAAGGNTTTAENSAVNSGSSASTKLNKIKVIASFYPIFEFVKKVGGDRVEVSSLIPVGIEPHDYEPTIQQVQNAETADMLVFNGAGFEGQWLKSINTKFAVDTSKGLNLTGSTYGYAGDDDEHSRKLLDPHIWLDPLLAKQQVEKIRDGLKRVDPANAAFYNENAKRFIAELDNLDKKIRSELSNCEKKDFITFHRAFGYFANRYGLTEHEIHPNSPEGEILPQRIEQIIGLARDMGLDTIYSEELVDPRLANVIAQEIPNGRVLVLGPIEGIDKEEQNAGIGYIDKMNENIENLKIGLKCK